MHLDRSSDEFLQRQICAGLRRAVASGVLGPGSRLPSSRALAASLGVSRTTVVASLLRLVEEGYLVSRERSGTFVALELPVDLPGDPSDALGDGPAEARAAHAGDPARPGNGAGVRLSRRADDLARAGASPGPRAPRPRAFRLARPALEAFPVREWSRILSRRAARVTAAQLDYGPDSSELCAAIAQLVASGRGMRARPEQVLLFGGGQRALEFAVASVLDPGEEAWMEDPGYAGARSALRTAGAAVTPVPIDEHGMVVAAGREAAPRARLVYATPSCQFPLGVTMSLERRAELLEWAEQAGAFIVEDDYDAEFRHEGAPLASLSGLDRSGRVLYVGSFSRMLFPALRLGFLVAPPAVADRLRAARAAMEEQLPSLFQLALADFIAEGHFARHLRRMRVLYRERREALLAAARAAGPHRLVVRPSPSGLHVIADLPAGTDASAVSAAAARRGVEAAPLSSFHADPPARCSSLVLGFGGVDPASAAGAMERLAAAIDEVCGRPVDGRA